MGATRTYHTLGSLLAAVTLAPGDVVEIDSGTYNEVDRILAQDSGTPDNPIIIRGPPASAGTANRPVFDGTGLDVSGTLPNPRAILQVEGHDIIFEHLELKNAHNGCNGSGFRVTRGGYNVTFDDIYIHDNDMGAQSDGTATVTVLRSEFAHSHGSACSGGEKASHNAYFSGVSVRMIACYSHDSGLADTYPGELFKSRAHYNYIACNRFEQAGNYPIDCVNDPPQTGAPGSGTTIPNSNCVLAGNLIIDDAQSANTSQTLLFGHNSSDPSSRNGNFYILYNTFILATSSGHLIHMNEPVAGSKAYFYDNIIHTLQSGASIAQDATTAPLIEGARNFVTTGIAAPAGLLDTIAGASPLLDSQYYPASGSPVLGQATTPVSFVDGDGISHTWSPSEQYQYDLGLAPRNSSGASPDLGALSPLANP